MHAAFTGGEFSDVKDVEFAYFTFARKTPASPDLNVTAKVRNGLEIGVEHLQLTMSFLAANKKELKKFTYPIPGVLKPGEVVKKDGLVFKIERVEKRRVMRVKLEILQTNGEGEAKDELDRARSSTGNP